MSENVPKKDLIVQLLTVLFPDASIYLFGSCARGDFKSTSDIDIAINNHKKIDYQEIIRAKNVLEALNVPQTIDVVDYHSIPAEMRALIEREKVVWKN